ncbi:hypothetical protein [Acinetobacter sp. P1(2025)]|uniref:hypothetical protein n=1 Tax=Acinetobacter sp. P1(2025) TaxID=3446120 RepID=UPI003F53A9FC
MFHGKNAIQSEATYIASFIGENSIALDIYYIREEHCLAIVHSDNESRNRIMSVDTLTSNPRLDGDWLRACDALKSYKYAHRASLN